MDSGNSGSMPSSSGGDEESISSFLNSNNPSPHQQINLTNQNPTFFNPHHSSHNQYNDESNINNNPHHVIWSGNYLRPESNLQNLINNNPSSLLLPSSSKSQSTIIINEAPFPNPSPSVVPKNPKKRTRASRRAPTTVLTTDTSNFRQMVQEFTGIPTVPLSSPFTNRRFDLFPGGPHFNRLSPLLGPSSSPSLSYSNMIGTSSNSTATSKSDNFQMPFEYHNQYYYLNQQNASMNYGGLNHNGTSLVAAPTLQDHDESSSQQVMERYYTNSDEK